MHNKSSENALQKHEKHQLNIMGTTYLQMIEREHFFFQNSVSNEILLPIQ